MLMPGTTNREGSDGRNDGSIFSVKRSHSTSPNKMQSMNHPGEKNTVEKKWPSSGLS